MSDLVALGVLSFLLIGSCMTYMACIGCCVCLRCRCDWRSDIEEARVDLEQCEGRGKKRERREMPELDATLKKKQHELDRSDRRGRAFSLTATLNY